MKKILGLIIAIFALANLLATTSYENRKEVYDKIESSKLKFEKVTEILQKSAITSKKFEDNLQNYLSNQEDLAGAIEYFAELASITSEIATINRTVSIDNNIQPEVKFLIYPDNLSYIKTVYGEDYLEAYKMVLAIFEKKALIESGDKKFFTIAANGFKHGLPDFLFQTIAAKDLQNKLTALALNKPINIPMYLNIVILILGIVVAILEYRDKDQQEDRA